MGALFTLDDDIKGVIRTALDDLITELGKDCLLVYPPRTVACANCLTDPVSGRSVGRYRHGGPAPFSQGRCPLCANQGSTQSESSEAVRLLCNWEPKKFSNRVLDAGLRAPHSLLETKGYLRDMPKVQKADHLVLATPIAGLGTRRFKLLSEPGDRSNIIQGRYFVCTWERVA